MTTFTNVRYSNKPSITLIDSTFCKTVFRLTDLTKTDYWPIWVDGNMGAVVVYDETGAFDDFLVIFNFGDDFMLYFKRWERDFQFFE